ncbi:MAG: membrane protein insertase YidC [Xanthomonadales bacterium]
MGNLRPVLIMGLVLIGYMIWVQWQRDYGPAPQTPTTASEPASAEVRPPTDAPDLPDLGEAPAADLPAAQPAPATPAATPTDAMASGAALVHVTTDVLDVRIDPVGATVVSAVLRDYPVHLDQPDIKVELLERHPGRLFVAQSGLLSRAAAPNHTSRFETARERYQLDTGADSLEVPFRWVSDDGLTVTKTFTFHRGRYDIGLSHAVANDGDTGWSGSYYSQLQRNVPVGEEEAGFTNPGRYSFFGIGFFNPEDKFEKIAFDDVAEDPFRKTTTQGWLAMIQHYFFAAWIPVGDAQMTYTTQAIAGDNGPRYIARAVSTVRTVAPGERTAFDGTLYVGPKLQEVIPDVAPGLEYTVNYGIFTVFSKPLYWLLSKIHAFVGNWGWAIVLLTVLIKAAFFKLTEAQYRSTARMRKLQPRIEQLKERYGDDRQRMSQAMMEMYKKEKVNPLGGCLPILVQIPIFIALYWVLLESVELRQAPFILWINNLSVRDPYFILPALNAVFMFATQRLTPMVGMDPLQQKIMTMMPVIFSIMFAFFPAGLVLYWATNAGLSLAQQYYITRKIAAAG